MTATPNPGCRIEGPFFARDDDPNPVEEIDVAEVVAAARRTDIEALLAAARDFLSADEPDHAAYETALERVFPSGAEYAPSNHSLSDVEPDELAAAVRGCTGADPDPRGDPRVDASRLSILRRQFGLPDHEETVRDAPAAAEYLVVRRPSSDVSSLEISTVRVRIDPDEDPASDVVASRAAGEGDAVAAPRVRAPHFEAPAIKPRSDSLLDQVRLLRRILEADPSRNTNT